VEILKREQATLKALRAERKALLKRCAQASAQRCTSALNLALLRAGQHCYSIIPGYPRIKHTSPPSTTLHVECRTAFPAQV